MMGKDVSTTKRRFGAILNQLDEKTRNEIGVMLAELIAEAITDSFIATVRSRSMSCEHNRTLFEEQTAAIVTALDEAKADTKRFKWERHEAVIDLRKATERIAEMSNELEQIKASLDNGVLFEAIKIYQTNIAKAEAEAKYWERQYHASHHCEGMGR
jgi:hypothetical protein